MGFYLVASVAESVELVRIDLWMVVDSGWLFDGGSKLPWTEAPTGSWAHSFSRSSAGIDPDEDLNTQQLERLEVEQAVFWRYLETPV